MIDDKIASAITELFKLGMEELVETIVKKGYFIAPIQLITYQSNESGIIKPMSSSTAIVVDFTTKIIRNEDLYDMHAREVYDAFLDIIKWYGC